MTENSILLRKLHSEKRWDELYERVEKLMFYKLRHHISNNIITEEEAYTCIDMGFVQAINSYDGERGEVSTLMGVCVVNEYRRLMMNKAREKRVNLVSYDNTPVGVTAELVDESRYIEYLCYTSGNIVESAEESVFQEYEYEELKLAMNKLKPRYRSILEGYYLQGKTQDELSKIHNVSQVQISRLISSALESLRMYMGVSNIKIEPGKSTREKCFEVFRQGGRAKAAVHLLGVSLGSARTYYTEYNKTEGAKYDRRIS